MVLSSRSAVFCALKLQQRDIRCLPATRLGWQSPCAASAVAALAAARQSPCAEVASCSESNAAAHLLDLPCAVPSPSVCHWCSPDSGLIKGTPAEGGNWTFEIAASNGAVTQSVPVPATIPVLGLPRFSAQSPPGSVVVDTAYGPYTFAAWVVPNATITYSLGPKGGLPPGVTGNPSTGELSGTPTATGSFNFTVIASVPWGSTASSGPLRPGTPHVIRVVNVPTSMVWTNYTPPMYAPVGKPYAAYRFRVATTSANGGPVELTYEVQPDGQVPDGLTLDEDTGRLFGVATTPGVFNFSTVAYAPDKLASAVVPANATIIAMTLPAFVNATPPSSEVNATMDPYRFVATCEPDSPITYGFEGVLPAGESSQSPGTASGC